MMKSKFLQPVIKEVCVSVPTLICVSGGVDPSGEADDFGWDYSAGVISDGYSDDFKWDN